MISGAISCYSLQSYVPKPGTQGFSLLSGLGIWGVMVLNGIIRILLYIGKVARVDVETMSDHVSHYGSRAKVGD
jgi:hypothetical protein